MTLKMLRKKPSRFLVWTNAILIISFLLSCYGGYLDPERFWYIGLLIMGSFFLFLLILIYVFFWLIRKRKGLFFINVVVLIAAWPAFKNVLQVRFPGKFKIEKAAGDIRMLDWNVETFNLMKSDKDPGGKQRMFELVKLYKPDIATFQEAVIGIKDKRATNYLPDLLDSFGYKNYHFVHRGAYEYYHKVGLVTFSNYKYIKQYRKISSPFGYNDQFSYVDMVAGKDTIRVFNLHFQSLDFSNSEMDYLNNFQEKNPNNRLRAIVSKLKHGFVRRKWQAIIIKQEIDKSPYPTIVCGDFNDVPNSYAYNTIKKGMNNAFAKKGSGLSRSYSEISPTLRIDNIFTSKEIKINQFTTVRQDVSDHHPIMADFSIRKK